jgi:hypothetical protein
MAENLEHKGHHGPPNEAGTADYERTDANVITIIKWGIILGLGTAAVLLIVVGIFKFLTTNETTEVNANPLYTPKQMELPKEPRLEPVPGTQLSQTRAYEDKILSTYGWADRNAKTVHIPIDRAIDLLVQRGVPTRKQVYAPVPSEMSANKQDGTTLH